MGRAGVKSSGFYKRFCSMLRQSWCQKEARLLAVLHRIRQVNQSPRRFSHPDLPCLHVCVLCCTTATILCYDPGPWPGPTSTSCVKRQPNTVHKQFAKLYPSIGWCHLSTLSSPIPLLHACLCGIRTSDRANLYCWHLIVTKSHSSCRR